jgi:hypothetical protein
MRVGVFAWWGHRAMIRDRLARQSRRGLRDLERITHCAIRSGGGEMRTHLLTTVAAVALLAALPARAQDATWSTAPGSSNFNTAANWTPATVPTGTAFFGASNMTSITFQPFTTTSIGTLQFNPGAPAYSFINLQASPHQSVSPVPASLTIRPTHRLLSSATRRTFFFAMGAPPATPS